MTTAADRRVRARENTAIDERFNSVETANGRTEQAVKELGESTKEQIGSLRQETSSQIGNLASETRQQIGGVRQDMSTQIGQLSSALSQVATDLGKKIDDQVSAAAKSQRTDWGVIGIFGGTLLAVAASIGSLALTPINRDLDRIDATTRDIGHTYVSRDDLRDILAYGVKRFDRLDDQVDRLREQSISKDDERDYRAAMSDQVKTIYQQLDALRDRVSPAMPAAK